MLIKVKTLTGKEIEIDIEPTDKVERIKERVEEKEGIPPPQQRLIFSGKQMNDEKTAADYKVTLRLNIICLKTILLGSRRFCSPSCSRFERWSFLSGTLVNFINFETTLYTS